MIDAFTLMYKRLADFFVENVDFRRVSNIIEVGCGKGQLTMPLVERVSRLKKHFKLVAFDMSVGPYRDHLNVLENKIMRQRLGRFVAVVRGDVTDMRNVGNENVDLIVSNELLCDLNRASLERAFREFYRILKPNGQMVHGTLSPFPENEAQMLLIEADAHALETLQPKPEWFSPTSDETASLMHKIGFRNMITRYFETNVEMSFETAVGYLEEWTNQDFVKSHFNELHKYGLEFPVEHVIFCEK